MKNQMTITVLKSSQYNQLHRKHPNIKLKDLRNSLGCAIPKENKAYIRLTNDNQENMDSAHHELEELMSKKSTDEVNGVRYKSFMRSFGKTFVGRYVVPAALFAVPGVGPALAAAYSGINAYQKDNTAQSAIMGGVEGLMSGVAGQGVGGAISGGIKGGTAAAPGFLSKAGGIISGAGAGLSAGINKGLNMLPGVSGLNETANIGTSLATGSIGTGTGTLAYGGGTAAGGATSMVAPTIASGAGTTAATSWVPEALNIGTNLATGQGVQNLTAGGLPPTGNLTVNGTPITATSEAMNTVPQYQATTEVGKTLMQKLGSQLGATGKTGLGMMLASGLGSTMAKPPTATYTPEEYIKTAKATMEKYGLNALPQYAQEEVRKLVELPISGAELEAQVDDSFARQDEDLEASREDQIQLVNQRYAQAGSTGDTQQAQDIARVNDYIDAQKVVARGEARANILAKSYEVKSNALQTVMQSGSYDTNLAMQLATMIGKQDELNNALELQDYASFQETMSSIFSTGMQAVLETIMKKQFPEGTPA